MNNANSQNIKDHWEREDLSEAIRATLIDSGKTSTHSRWMISRRSISFTRAANALPNVLQISPG